MLPNRGRGTQPVGHYHNDCMVANRTMAEKDQVGSDFSSTVPRHRSILLGLLNLVVFCLLIAPVHTQSDRAYSVPAMASSAASFSSFAFSLASRSLGCLLLLPRPMLFTNISSFLSLCLVATRPRSHAVVSARGHTLAATPQPTLVAATSLSAALAAFENHSLFHLRE